jgi:hypothetical protein
MALNLRTPIAQRSLRLSEPFEREVVVIIGAPTQHGPNQASCEFQVVGLADDDVQTAIGVDTLQALSLALVGARRQIRDTMKVLERFHPDVSLTWEGADWSVALPLWVPLWDSAQVGPLEDFIDRLAEFSGPAAASADERLVDGQGDA